MLKMPMIYVPTTRNPRRSTWGGRGQYTKRKTRRGRGQYTLDTGKWANRGASIGGAIASAFGAPAGIGSWLGRRAFHYPAKWFGSGQYTKRPKRVKGRGDYSTGDVLAPTPPRFSSSSKDNATVVEYREYLGDVVTSSVAGNFSIQNFTLNPSSPSTFPWLSTMVLENFQQYMFDGLIFEFKSTSADALNSTNTALGAVFACVNYDPTDPAPVNRRMVENTDWSASCKPSECMEIGVECAKNQTTLGGMHYCLNAPSMPSGTDPRLYFMGRFYIGTVGFQGTSVNIGSLYVKYKVRLYKPLITKPLAEANRVLYERTGVGNADPFGTANDTSAGALTYSCDSMGITFTSTVMTIPKRRLQNGMRFYFTWNVMGGAVAWTAPTFTLSAGLSGLGAWNNGANTSQVFPANAVNAGNVWYITFFEVANETVDATITLGAGGTLPTAARCNVQLIQCSGLQNTDIGFVTAINS